MMKMGEYRPIYYGRSKAGIADMRWNEGAGTTAWRHGTVERSDKQQKKGNHELNLLSIDRCVRILQGVRA